MARRTWEQYENYILQQWPLTRREVQVALECIKGRKNKEIASLLGIGAETVNRQNIDNTSAGIKAVINSRETAYREIEKIPSEIGNGGPPEGGLIISAGFPPALRVTQ